MSTYTKVQSILNSSVVCPFQVGDIVRYTPTMRRSDTEGTVCKVEAIRDIVVHPLGKSPKWGSPPVVRSRYLLTCVLPNGQYRSFYHTQATKVDTCQYCDRETECITDNTGHSICNDCALEYLTIE